MPLCVRAAPGVVALLLISPACKNDGEAGPGPSDGGTGSTSSATQTGSSGDGSGDGNDDDGADPGTLCTAGDLEDVWRERTPMPAGARQNMGVAVLDGQVWVAGGLGGDGETRLDTVEIYDPEAQTWASGPALPVAMANPNLGAAGGTLWILGYTLGSTAEPAMYRLESNAWVDAGTMPGGRERGASALLEIDGILHMLGGLRAGSPVADHDAFDPTAMGFTERARVPTPRSGLAVASVAGMVLAMGGRESASGAAKTNVDFYDAAADAWTVGPELPIPRAGAVAFTLDGELYVCGGTTSGASITARCDRFDPEGECWRESAGMLEVRHATQAVVIGDKAFVPGGARSRDISPTDTMFEFDPW